MRFILDFSSSTIYQNEKELEMTTTTETCYPAIGDETISNPNYIPAVDGYSVEVANPDYVPATPATTELVGVMKWNWTGGPINHTPAAPGGTDDYGWHQVGITNDSKGDALDVVHAGNGKASYFYYEQVWEDVPAVPEQGTPTIEIWVDGTPAVGEEVIANPDYTAPYCETNTPVPVLECPPNKVPGWLDENGNPQGCVDNNPNPLQPKDEIPVVDAPAPETVETVSPTPAVLVDTAAPNELAVTGGFDLLPLVLIAAALTTSGVAMIRKAVAR